MITLACSPGYTPGRFIIMSSFTLTTTIYVHVHLSFVPVKTLKSTS